MTSYMHVLYIEFACASEGCSPASGTTFVVHQLSTDIELSSVKCLMVPVCPLKQLVSFLYIKLPPVYTMMSIIFVQ